MINANRNQVLMGLLSAQLLSYGQVMAHMGPDVTHPENTSVDTEQSTKFQGKISWQRYFYYWVDKQLVPAINRDDFLCSFKFRVEQPFTKAGDDRYAIWFGQDCPKDMFDMAGIGSDILIQLTTDADIYFFDRDMEQRPQCSDIFARETEPTKFLVTCTFQSSAKTEKGKDLFNDFGVLMPITWDNTYQYSYDFIAPQ